MVTVFGLFPAGLQNAADDAADTRAGLFAGTVLNGMRGSAAAINDTNTWDTSFATSVSVPNLTLDGTASVIPFPPGADPSFPENYIRYSVSIAPVPHSGPRAIYSATLYTSDGKYGASTTQNVFYTEFSFMGM